MRLLPLLLACASTCTISPWCEKPMPWTPASIAGKATARAKLTDGSTIELSQPRIEGPFEALELIGMPPTHAGITPVERRIPLSGVQRLEGRHTEFWPVVANVVGITVVIVVNAALLVPPFVL
jgi:hypothetical protein